MRILLKLAGILFIVSHSALGQITGLSGWNIFLDPGHSQKENMGIYGYSEAEKNLKVALYLRDMLLKSTDIDTVYTSRTNDQEVVSLSQRTDYANRLGTAWFHSIHSDAGSPEFTSTLLLWGQYYNGNEKVPRGGKAMADIMVSILTRGMRTDTRGSIGDCSFYTWSDWCKQSGGPYLHVNRTTNMPSELSEAGFHTNPTQNQRNMNAEWQKLQAQTFFWSILKFHHIIRPFAGICAGIISDLDTHVPVNGARVKLNGQIYVTDSFESLFYRYTTDPNLLHNGFYYFENLPDSTLQMVVEAPGYYSDTLQVAISDTFFTFKDLKLVSRECPYVIATLPAEGDPAFPAWKSIQIDFSRQMERAVVEANVKFTPDIARTFSWSNNNRQLKIHTDTLKFVTDYTILISGQAKDIHGHLLDGNHDGVGGDDFILRFKSSAKDIVPPKILSTFPKSNATNIELLPLINIIFNEELNITSIADTAIILERNSDKTLVPGTIKHYLIHNQSILSFFPSLELAPEEIYTIKIYPGLADIFGNRMTTTRSITFKTTGLNDTITLIDDFESNMNNNWWQPQQSGSTTGIKTDFTSRSADTRIVNLLTKSNTSLKISYGWELGASDWLIRVYLTDEAAPKSVLFDNTSILQIYLYGDGSGNEFRLALDDNYPIITTQNHEVSPWYTIDWLGWKLISWNLSEDGTGDWYGDGNLDGTLRFDSIQLTHAQNGGETGAIYLDDLRLVKKIPVPVQHATSLVPEDFALLQNYPNPFNPETTIKYYVPLPGRHVVLMVYNLLGTRIKTLVDEKQAAGVHEIRWDGTDDQDRKAASGIYICKLTGDNRTRATRMILLK